MNIEEDLYNAAIELAKSRYSTGWSGAAAIYTKSGKILTSIAPETKNDSLALCMEIGAYLEAHKLNEKVTHSLCVSRKNENSTFIILTPCGICQERLIHWGEETLAAITNPENKVIFKTIKELQPHHWSSANRKELHQES